MQTKKGEKLVTNLPNLTKGDSLNGSPLVFNKLKYKMELFTKEIIEKAKAQYPLGSDMNNQVIVAKFFNPVGAGTWFLMNMDPNDENYCWGIVDLFEVEVGSFSKSELENFKGHLGLGIERDLYFEPVNAKELWEKLLKGAHV